MRYRMLERHGRDVTITRFSFGAENEHGDAERIEESETVTARVDRLNQGEVVHGPDGEDHTVDVDFFVRDSVIVDDEAPVSEFTVDDKTYSVLVADNQDAGLIRVRCQRKM